MQRFASIKLFSSLIPKILRKISGIMCGSDCGKKEGDLVTLLMITVSLPNGTVQTLCQGRAMTAFALHIL